MMLIRKKKVPDVNRKQFQDEGKVEEKACEVTPPWAGNSGGASYPLCAGMQPELHRSRTHAALTLTLTLVCLLPPLGSNYSVSSLTPSIL